MKSLEALNLKDYTIKLHPQFSLSMRNAKNGPIRGKLDQTKILINENMMSNMKRINDNVILDVSEIASGCTGS